MTFVSLGFSFPMLSSNTKLTGNETAINKHHYVFIQLKYYSFITLFGAV